MQTAGIIVNKDKDPGLEYAEKVRAFLQSRGFRAEIVSRSAWGDAVHSPFSSASFWVVLGGDGTMLRAAHFAAVHDVPLLGINLGTLGFLTDVDKKHGEEALEKLLDGKFESEKRLMLEAEFASDCIMSIHSRLALNDICVGASDRLREFSIYINDRHTDVVRADGIIVATPTGSTAYNLSAGGPILIPGGQMTVITPICPHSLSARPWVISGTDTVRVVSRMEANVTVDGEVRGVIPPGESVFIQTSKHRATILKTAPAHFYATLRKKKII